MAAQMQDTMPVAGVIEQPQAMVPATTPADLLQMAVMQGADLDRLERLMALQERWEANEARKAFNEALAAFKGESIVIRKRKRVHFTSAKGTTDYKHAELSDVTEAIGPALARYGLAYTWDVQQPNANTVKVTCKLTHKAGHSESITMEAAPDDTGNKNRIQQIGSTATYLQRYTLLALTGCSTKGQDNDGRGNVPNGQPPEGVPPEPTAAEIEAQRKAEKAALDAKRKAQHDEAWGRNSESIDHIKARLEAGDTKAAQAEWAQFSVDDQLALWLAPSKGGCLSTAEREQLRPANSHGDAK